MWSKLKQHYHWLIALLVFLEMIIFGGLINSASIFTLPISTSLGVSTTAYSVSTMPYTITCFLTTSLSSVLFARFGYKKVSIVALVLVTASLVLTACCNDLVVFGFSKVLLGVGYGFCFVAGSVRIVRDWFCKHVGLVLGAVSMATGIGGSLMTILFSTVIENYGWRTANMVAAVIVAVITVLYFLLKDRPEQMGLRPYGYGHLEKQKKQARTDASDWPGFELGEQLRRPFFYLACLCVVATCVCVYTTSSFIVPHFEAQGFSTEEAAMYQSVYMLTLAVAKLALGWLYDRVGVKPVVVLCMLCASAGQGILAYAADPVLNMVGMVIFSVGLCMTAFATPLLAISLFGYKASMGVNGILLGLSSLSVLLSGPISSMSYDTWKSYVPVYRVTSVILLGILGLYLVLFALSKRERKVYYARHPEA